MKPAGVRLVLLAIIAAATHDARIFNRAGGKTHDPRCTRFVPMIWRTWLVKETSGRSLRLPPGLPKGLSGRSGHLRRWRVIIRFCRVLYLFYSAHTHFCRRSAALINRCASLDILNSTEPRTC
jgi:hypothetical protein